MGPTVLKNQKGGGLFGALLWVGLLTLLAWVAYQYLSNPNRRDSIRTTHSPLEDSN